jgi:predicted  nucleic acid-binding Zn-ribbon protein
MVNQKVQDALKIFLDTTNKKLVNTQKHLNELREDFNKHQSKAKDTIKEDVSEINRTTQDIKKQLIWKISEKRIKWKSCK